MDVMCLFQSKKEGKDQEWIQPSTPPDLGYQWESDNVESRHHKREPRCQPLSKAKKNITYIISLKKIELITWL